jgi:hypothetical protein
VKSCAACGKALERATYFIAKQQLIERVAPIFSLVAKLRQAGTDHLPHEPARWKLLLLSSFGSFILFPS